MTWPNRLWQDLQPTPGRLSTSLRIVLATLLTLILLMTWQIPSAAIGLYLVFMVSRDSPAVSLRGGILSMVTLSAAVGAVLGVVDFTDNDPMARVVSVAAVGFVVGMVMRATTLGGLGVIFGFIYCFLIANWEFHLPADTLVRTSLWVISAGVVAIGCSVAVEYVFGAANPVNRLQQQLQVRYKALENLFKLMAEGVTAEQLSPASDLVTRLAASGQTAMQELYSSVVDRNLDPASLPIGSREHITILAQLMDLSAAFASQFPDISMPQIADRCARIAAWCHQLASRDVSTPVGRLEQERNPPLTLLDRIEFVLWTLACMPQRSRSIDKELIALPSKKVPLFVPGGLRNPESIAFALKISLCATACYVFNHAVDWPGISTSVATVFLTALSTSGAIKQKLLFRVVGSAIGGLAFGIGATAFLFPQMDSITSIVVLVATVAFIAAWFSTGRYFNYVGLQIALAFYFVAFQGFGAPRELAPARDRFVGILVGLVAMWFVFDQIWPVRTITVMLRGLGSVLRNGASLFQLGQSGNLENEEVRQANALRDQVGKTVAELRTLNDAAEYEFGVDLDKQRRGSQAILRTAFSAVAMFWNQMVAVATEENDVLRAPQLVDMRVAFAAELNSMAEAVTRNNLSSLPAPGSSFSGSVIFDDPRNGEYARNIVNRLAELRAAVLHLNDELMRD